jgi:hypothetical protein
MLARSLLPWCMATISIFVLGSRAANAACVISGMRPTVPLPTLAAGQQFSFIATADCEKLRFRVPGTRFVAIPKGGPDTGARLRTYKVVLTESEWSSLVDEGDTAFTWSIIGTTSAGVTTRVTTTNELKVEDGVTIDLSMADAKLVGEAGGDQASNVSGAGDVDGDGHDDLLVGAAGNDEGGTTAGAAYLVLGPVTGTLDLSLADAKLVGEEASDYAGAAVAGAGDVDRDGHDDLLVGAPGEYGDGDAAGAAYLVLGPVTGTLDLSLADAKLVGGYAGAGVSGAGDVDGDGHDDLLITPEHSSERPIHLVLGPVTGTLELLLSDAKLVAEERDENMTRGSGAGDVNADGHDDLLLGAFGDHGNTDSGSAYVVLGPVTGTLDMPSQADAELVGEAANDIAGIAVSGAGDVDSDGHDDLLVGAIGNDNGVEWSAGAAYLVLGPVTGTFDLSLAHAKLQGDASESVGFSVSGAGDVDANGHDDVLVGKQWGSAESVYLVLGPVSGTVDLSFADATFVGENDADYAYRISGAGDVDADGRADIMVGAHGNDEGGDDAGAAYLLYGGGL